MQLKPTSVITLSTLMASMLLAQSPNTLAQRQWLPAHPSLQISGTLGQEGIVSANGLVPLYGNWDGFMYGAVDARYSTDDTGLLAPGLGLRYVAHNNLYGAYVFTDAARTNKANLWVINPGLEWASTRWDVHVNGYIPTQRSKELGQADFYSNYGDYSHTSFTGHRQYDELAALSVAVGQGLDTEVGYSVAMGQYRSRLFLGGYYFNMPQQLKALQGVAGGIQLPLNAYTDLVVTDSYDKLRRHEVALSVRLTLGHKNTFSDDVHTRLLEGVERHVGMWTTGAGTVTREALQATGRTSLYKDNIWFFKPNGNTVAEPVSLQACTFEHPCAQFDQATIDSINQLAANANFYLTPGTYNIAGESNQESSAMFRLNQGQAIYGRSLTYQAPAREDDRALLAGPVKALGNNVLDSVQIVNNGIVTKLMEDEEPDIIGLYLPEDTAAAVTLKNTKVWALNTLGTTSDKLIGVLNEGGQVILNDSTILAEGSGNGQKTVGITSYDSPVTLNGSSILAKTSGGGWVGGIESQDSPVTLNGSTILAEASGYFGWAIGIHSVDSQVTLNDSTILSEASGDYGFALGISSYKSLVTLNDSAILAEALGDEGVRAEGIWNSYGNVEANNVTITVKNMRDDNSIGLSNLNGGTISAKNVHLNVFGAENKTKLIEGETNNIQFSSNTVCKVNGLVVDCHPS